MMCWLCSPSTFYRSGVERIAGRAFERLVWGGRGDTMSVILGTLLGGSPCAMADYRSITMLSTLCNCIGSQIF